MRVLDAGQTPVTRRRPITRVEGGSCAQETGKEPRRQVSGGSRFRRGKEAGRGQSRPAEVPGARARGRHQLAAGRDGGEGDRRGFSERTDRRLDQAYVSRLALDPRGAGRLRIDHDRARFRLALLPASHSFAHSRAAGIESAGAEVLLMKACPRRPLRRGLAIVLFAALCGWAGVAGTHAQAADAPEEKFLGAKPDTPGQGQMEPFSITAGPEGAVLKGEDTFLIARGRGRRTRVTPYARVLVDANWSPRRDALDNASLTLQPSVGIQRIGQQDGGPISHGAWFYAHLDFRQRKGDFKDETSGRVESVNQTILGAGVEFKLTSLYEAYRKAANTTGFFNDYPRIDIDYFGVAHNSEPGGDLPDGVVVHHV